MFLYITAKICRPVNIFCLEDLNTKKKKGTFHLTKITPISFKNLCLPTHTKW